jgi:hypothetical protein
MDTLSETYKAVLTLFKLNRDYIKSLMAKQHLDGLILPINPEGSASYDVSSVNTWRAALQAIPKVSHPCLLAWGSSASNMMNHC